MMESDLLLVEDDPLLREMLVEALLDKGYLLSIAETGQQALEMIRQGSFAVALLDIRLPDLDGLSLLELLTEHQPECTVLLMTGEATIEAAVAAMQAGAYDYLAKPFRLEVLLIKLERLFCLKALERENRRLRAGGNDDIVASSSRMRRFLATVANVADTSATVLLQGESGTGKELVAELLHRLSTRTAGALVKVNCGAIPESLLEAELFGFEKGAFTGAERQRRGYLEQAHGGTLFLDEIGEIPHAMQVRLLRSLQERKVRRLGGEEEVAADFRLVAATHRELEELRENGTIRDDFFYRLNVVPLRLPPLRERRDDIPLLIDHFVRRFAERHRREPIRLAGATLEQLLAYPFPGNVRELENLIERLQVLHPGAEIAPRDLPPEFRRGGEISQELVQCFRTDLPLRQALRDFERRFIDRVLQEEGGNRTAAARRLGISRKNLWERLQD